MSFEFRLANLTLKGLCDLVETHMLTYPSVAAYDVWIDVMGMYDRVADVKLTIMDEKNLLLTHTPVTSSSGEHMLISQFSAALRQFLSDNPQYADYYLWREVFEMSEPLMDFELCHGELFESIIR
jgi:hypothetical protein